MLTLTILSQAEGLDWSCQRLVPGSHGLIMGGINFSWLAVWVLSPDRLSPKLEVCEFCQALRWSHAWVEGSAGRTATLHRIPWHLPYNWEKITENLSHGIRKGLGWPALNAIRLVDLAITGDGLDWPAGPCRLWLSRQATGSTLGQRKYLPSCRTRGFPTLANFESKLSVRALMW